MIIFILCAAFLSACKSGPAATDSKAEESLLQKKQVWLYMKDISAFSDTSSWQYTFENTDVVVINISVIKKLNAADINKLTEVINASNIKLAVECSGLVSVFGTDTFHNAEKSMAYNSVNHTQKGEYTYLAPLIDSGCKIDYLIFQNSVTNAIYPNADYKTTDNRFMTIAEAVSQTVEEMKCWREHLPAVQFLLYTDYYNYGWKGETAYNLVYNNEFGAGDYYYELSLAAETAETAGIPLFGLVVNDPYDYAMGRHSGDLKTAETPSRTDWMARLCDLENECNTRGLNFILTLNCDSSGKNGSDEKYYNDLIHFMNKYTEAGGTPEAFIIRGGSSYPSYIVPETADFSLTYDASKFIANIKNGEDISLSLTSTKKTVDVPENLTLISEWNFDEDSGGWRGQNNISDFYTENGYLSVISNGGDPNFQSEDNLKLNTADCNYLYIKYMNVSSSSDRMEFFFSTNESTGMDEIKTIKFSVDTISDDEVWSEIYIPLAQCDAWKGTLKQMRLDPGMTSGEFRFDCIALYRQG
jgi:hypothetical protein